MKILLGLIIALFLFDLLSITIDILFCKKDFFTPTKKEIKSTIVGYLLTIWVCFGIMLFCDLNDSENKMTLTNTEKIGTKTILTYKIIK
jgi:hypothetical protein